MSLDEDIAKQATAFLDLNRFKPNHGGISSYIGGNKRLPIFRQNDSAATEAYTCAHHVIDGHTHVKTPTIYSFSIAYTAQAILEWKFNEHFHTIVTSPQASIDNEVRAYRKLGRLGFPTLRISPAQEQVKGKPLLLTIRENDVQNMSTVMIDPHVSDETIYRLTFKVGKQLQKLHYHREIWGDAKPANVLLKDGVDEPLIFDFGPIVNKTHLSTLQLRAKDMQFFIYNMMKGRDKLDADGFIESFLDGYSPSLQMERELQRTILRQRKFLKYVNRFQGLYLTTAHKCGPDGFEEICEVIREIA